MALFPELKCYAQENEPVLIKARATAYCLPGTTASGQEVRKGICASGNKDYFGKTVVVYQRLPSDEVGEIIGIYEVLDCGCSKHVIDVWCPDLNECQEFMNRVYEDGCQGKIFVQVLEGDG